MEYVKLGNITVPRIIIGTWSWGDGFLGGKDVFGNDTNVSNLREVFVSAIRNDFVMYDTAEVYGGGDSERIIGLLSEYYNGKVEIEKGSKKQIQISTKFMPKLFKSKDSLRKSLEGSLKRLDREDVDIFWLHTSTQYKKWIKEIIPLLKESKIKNVGVSNFNLDQIKDVKRILNEEGFELAGIQNHFSLIYQNCIDNGMLKWCHENNVKFFAYMVMEQGALSGKYTKENPMPEKSLRGKVYNEKFLASLEPIMNYIRELSMKYDVRPAQIPVAWALSKGTLPIIGATKQQHIYELTKSFEVTLKDDEIAHLEKLGKEVGFGVKRVWEPKL